jgi:hypothetical protein
MPPPTSLDEKLPESPRHGGPSLASIKGFYSPLRCHRTLKSNSPEELAGQAAHKLPQT